MENKKEKKSKEESDEFLEFGQFMKAGNEDGKENKIEKMEEGYPLNQTYRHISTIILDSLVHLLHLHRKLHVRVNSVNMSGEGTVFNFSLKSPLSLELHKKLMKINTVKLENKDVHVTLASGTVEHVYVNLEKIQPPNKLVMILSFGLGFLGIGGSVSVMIYLGTRMVGSPSRSEDSNHLLEAQMDEEEDDESDVFLGPAQPKPVPQISIISQRGYERKETNGKSSSQGETDYCAEPVFTIVQPPHTPPVVTGTPPVVSGSQADVGMSGVHSTKSTNLSVQRH